MGHFPLFGLSVRLAKT